MKDHLTNFELLCTEAKTLLEMVRNLRDIDTEAAREILNQLIDKYTLTRSEACSFLGTTSLEQLSSIEEIQNAVELRESEKIKFDRWTRLLNKLAAELACCEYIHPVARIRDAGRETITLGLSTVDSMKSNPECMNQLLVWFEQNGETLAQLRVNSTNLKFDDWPPIARPFADVLACIDSLSESSSHAEVLAKAESDLTEFSLESKTLLDVPVQAEGLQASEAETKQASDESTYIATNSTPRSSTALENAVQDVEKLKSSLPLDSSDLEIETSQSTNRVQDSSNRQLEESTSQDSNQGEVHEVVNRQPLMAARKPFEQQIATAPGISDKEALKDPANTPKELQSTEPSMSNFKDRSNEPEIAEENESSADPQKVKLVEEVYWRSISNNQFGLAYYIARTAKKLNLLGTLPLPEFASFGCLSEFVDSASEELTVRLQQDIVAIQHIDRDIAHALNTGTACCLLRVLCLRVLPGLAWNGEKGCVESTR